MNDGCRVFLLGGLVGLTLASVAGMLKTLETLHNTGMFFIEGELANAHNSSGCGNDIILILPTVSIAVSLGAWYLYARLRSASVQGIVSGILYGLLAAVTGTVAGFFVWILSHTANSEVANFHTLLFLSVLIYTLPTGLISGGTAFWLYWRTRAHFSALTKVPALIVFPLLVCMCEGVILSTIPQTKVVFLAERWRDNIGDRHLMLPDLLAHHPLEGESVSEINRLIGTSEVLDPKSNSSTGTSNYYLGPNSMLQVFYNKQTGIIERYAVNQDFFPALKNVLAQSPLPETGTFVEEPSTPRQIKLDGKTFESSEHRTRRFGDILDKLGLDRWGTPVAELQTGELLVCSDLLAKNQSLHRQTWIVDPKSGRKRRGPNMQYGRETPSLYTLNDGRVLIIGGRDDQKSVSGPCELFDPTTNQMYSAGSLLIPREDAGIGQMSNGDVLVVGGIPRSGLADQDYMTSTVELIHFGENGVEHSMVGSLRRARCNPDVLPLGDNHAVIVGGEPGESQGDRFYTGADLYSGVSTTEVQ